MRRWFGGIAIVLAGCGASPPPERGADEAASCVEPPAENVAADAREEPENRCANLYDDEGRAAPWHEEPVATCANNPDGERAMRTRLAREYHRRTDPSRVDVEFGCDTLGDEVRALEIVHQHDYQLASHFTVARFTREDGGAFAVRAVRLELPAVEASEMTWESARRGTLLHWVGTVPAAAVDPLIPQLRAALVARTREVALPSRGARGAIVPRIGPIASPFTVRLIDAEERRLVGEGLTATSGGAQREWLGPTVAFQMLAGVLEEHAQWAETARDVEDAELVHHAIGPRREPPWSGPGYHGIQAYLDVRLGSDVLLAALEPIPFEEDVVPEGPLGVRMPFHDRARVFALHEIARRSGWRMDEGDARPIGDLAAEVLRECRAAAPR